MKNFQCIHPSFPLQVHQRRPSALANAHSCFAIPQIRFRFHILMLLLHSFRYKNHGILASNSSSEMPPAAYCASHHFISSRPCMPLGLVVVEFKLKGPAGRYHGSSSISRRREIGFACGKMIERNCLQVVMRAYIDRMGRNSHMARMTSGAIDPRVGLAFWRVCSGLTIS